MTSENTSIPLQPDVAAIASVRLYCTEIIGVENTWYKEVIQTKPVPDTTTTLPSPHQSSFTGSLSAAQVAPLQLHQYSWNCRMCSITHTLRNIFFWEQLLEQTQWSYEGKVVL